MPRARPVKTEGGENLMRRKTVFISAYRNFSVRYILYSDIFKQLRENKDLKIVIFLKDNDLEYYRSKLGSDNVIFEPILFEKALNLLKSNHLSVFFVLVRKCMSGSVKGYENITDKTRISQYGEQFSKSLKGKLFFSAVRMCAALGKSSLQFRKMFVWLEELFFRGTIYDFYFRKYKPDILIISSVGYMIDPYFIRSAKRHRCKVASIIHSWDNTTTKDYRGANPDIVITWNNIMKQEVNIFHDVPEEKIWVGGIAHWDFYFNNNFTPRSKKEFLESHGLSQGKKIIFYGTSSYINFRNTFDVVEQLLENLSGEPVQLLVRLHPMYLLKQRGKNVQVVEQYKRRIDKLKAQYGNRVVFNLPAMKMLNDDIDMPIEDMNNLAEMLSYSDVLLTEYSTLMIEAAIFDLPVINVGLYNYRDTDKPASYFEERMHIKRIIETGAPKNAYTIGQLYEYIKWYLEDPSRDRELRKKLVDQEVDTNRGHAGEQIANYIYDLLYEKIRVNS